MSTLHAADAVDLDYLDRYTGGDRAINEDVLRLFDSQCAELLAGLEAAAENKDPKSWHQINHTLKGAARGIGATALADAAQAAEKADVADAAALAAAAKRVSARMRDVRVFIQRYIA
jgi:HPt (histidine-containing phosphotransfer) domain-containing protein